MFDNLKKFFKIRAKSGLNTGGGVSGSHNWRNLHDFTKGLDFENSYSHISRIANEFMAIRPYGIDSNGKRIKQSRVLDKIYRPNQQMSSADFREALAVMLLVHSKVHLLVWREEDGRAQPGGKITPENIAGFTFLEGTTEIIIGGEKRYRVGANEYTDKEVIELKGGINPYDLSGGYSPARASRKWANLDDYIASYQAGFFENGAVPAGEFIVTAGSVEEFNKIVDTLQAKHRGSGRNNNIIYTHAPIDPATGKPMQSQIQWVPFALPNNQLGLGEIFSQVNKKIDSSFGVPASVRGVNENNTYASVRIDEQIFLKYTVKPFALRVWSRFTHELNRITDGIGFVIAFDVDEVGVAEEEKTEAEKKVAELAIIEKGLGLGYSLNSIIDAFGLSNGYKLLEISGGSAKIDNDKPEVDEGGENQASPSGVSEKQDCGRCKYCEHDKGQCLKDSTKTKISKNQTQKQTELEAVFRQMTDLQIKKAIEGLEKTKNLEDDEIAGRLGLNEAELASFEEKIKLILWSLVLVEGTKAWDKLLGILAVNNVDAEGVTQFKISKKLMEYYGRQIGDFSRNYSDETARIIAEKVNFARENDLNKEELAREIRKVAEASEWRVQRIARTETHRAAGLAGVEAGVQIQNETGTRIYKEWVVGGINPCGYCLGMNGTRVNVAESYVKKGDILISKAKIRVNDYADIDMAGAHPNCNCTERFGVEETDSDMVADEKWRQIIIDELPKSLYKDVYGSGWKEFIFDERETLKDRELEITQLLAAELKTDKIYALRRVEKPDGVKTPDLLVDGVKADIKSCSSLKAIERNISKAKKQTGENGIAILDITNIDATMEEIKRKIGFYSEKKNMKTLVVKGNQILK